MSLPDRMSAVVLQRNGGMDAQEYRRDWPTPKLEPGYVIVRVHACGLNNTDVNARTGWYSPSVTAANSFEAGMYGHDELEIGAGDDTLDESIGFPRIQGADGAGVIAAVGKGVSASRIGETVIVDGWVRDAAYRIGDRHMAYVGMLIDGGFAEYMLVPTANARVVRTDYSFAELATFQTSSTTAENVLTRARLVREESILITGVSGRTGTALVQHAKARGARVIGVASKKKHRHVLEVGADAVIDRDTADLKGGVLAANNANHVDVIADLIGGPNFAKLLEALAPEGRYVVSGAMAGPIVELDLRTLYIKEVILTGATTFPPSIVGQAIEMIESGHVKPFLHKVYPLSRFVDAQTEFLKKEHFGAIVVVPDALMSSG